MDNRSAYEADVIAWSLEQAAALRAGDFSRLDIEHLADEIEDVGKSEKRELSIRMAVLLAHLLKWKSAGTAQQELAGHDQSPTPEDRAGDQVDA